MKILILLIMLATHHEMIGNASHYGFGWSGKRFGAAGIMVHADDPVAAHKTLPYGTIVRATNNDPKSKFYGQSTVVIIFDRGPFVAGRIIDMQPHSLWDIAGHGAGGCKVKLEVVSKKYACSDYYCLRKNLGVRRITDDKLKEMLLGI